MLKGNGKETANTSTRMGAGMGQTEVGDLGAQKIMFRQNPFMNSLSLENRLVAFYKYQGVTVSLNSGSLEGRRVNTADLGYVKEYT